MMSLSLKGANKLCRILSEIMGTVGEIVVLFKFPPKRERILGDINQSIEVSNDPTSLRSLKVFFETKIYNQRDVVYCHLSNIWV